MTHQSRRRYTTWPVIVAILAVLSSLAVGCKSHPDPFALELTDQKTLVLGKDFSGLPDDGLIEQSGQPFTFESTKGKPVLVTAIYTSCPMPDMCPMITSKIARVQATLDDMGVSPDQYRVVLLSFDPDRDTPEVMKTYAQNHHINLANARLVTGKKATLERVMDEIEVGAKPDDDGTFMHNMRTYVVDPEGKIATGFRQSGWTPKHVAIRVKSFI